MLAIYDKLFPCQLEFSLIKQVILPLHALITYTHVPELCSNTVPVGFSNHNMVALCRKGKIPKANAKIIYKRSYFFQTIHALPLFKHLFEVQVIQQKEHTHDQDTSH